jgi:hypothetical protein
MECFLGTDLNEEFTIIADEDKMTWLMARIHRFLDEGNVLIFGSTRVCAAVDVVCM